MKTTITAKESIGPRGMVRLRSYRAGTIAKAEPYIEQVHFLRMAITGRAPGIILDSMRGRLEQAEKAIAAIFDFNFLGIETASPNLIMQGALTGTDLFVQYLTAIGAGSGTIYGGINYAALGTGTTPPTIADTQLASESARIAITLAADISHNQAQMQFFFPDGVLPNGSYHEVGTFMNASATANSGNIFNRSLLGTTYTKTTGVDTTLEVDITFS